MVDQIITSEGNPIIKSINGLKLKKNRQRQQQFVVEGVRMLEEAIRNGVNLEMVLYSQGLLKVNGGPQLLTRLSDNFLIYKVDDKLMDKLSDTENPQGILAVASIKSIDIEKLFNKDNLFIVTLDRIQDPGNMGTIIRTAEGAGADCVILTKGSVDPYNSKALRASMGAIFHIPVIQWEDDEAELISTLKEKKIKLIASDVDTKTLYLDIDYSNRFAIAIGNEANGISKRILEEADERIKIPIYGKIESFNASIAAAILIYKAVEGKQ
ncbi:TrmH family RNA methyltransferase [Alkaliphilus serpentinus]|uniref:RNA methyltransferase n=1 Tax=Alkaliphilus serpentinus TaxID=1482731 RepID=A0A833HNP9_9FIRM|nr:RNA methyltransferase [Alkaliphilus serpentinus]KAB3529812.1 RNA methyltransferase [Alkaliphilus serpentinus]